MTSACLACTPKKLASKYSNPLSLPVLVGRPWRPGINYLKNINIVILFEK